MSAQDPFADRPAHARDLTRAVGRNQDLDCWRKRHHRREDDAPDEP
jgi:hypothetical protein